MYIVKFYEGIYYVVLLWISKKCTHTIVDSIIRVAYKEPVEKSTIKGNLKECISDAVQVYTKLRKEFTKFVKR